MEIRADKQFVNIKNIKRFSKLQLGDVNIKNLAKSDF